MTCWEALFSLAEKVMSRLYQVDDLIAIQNLFANLTLALFLILLSSSIRGESETIRELNRKHVLDRKEIVNLVQTQHDLLSKTKKTYSPADQHALVADGRGRAEGRGKSSGHGGDRGGGRCRHCKNKAMQREERASQGSHTQNPEHSAVE